MLAALSPYGVTNDRLDTVSNYYRYVRSEGQIWPTKPAVAYAVVTNGVVASFVITESGSGYSSPPRVSVPGFDVPGIKVQLAFGPDFKEKGSLSAIELSAPK